jgi:prevent-host-death family protein
MDMNTITVSIGEGRAQLCGLIKKVKAGAHVILTNYGNPEAVICPYRPPGKRNRVAVPTPASHFGDIQSPVMEDWK